MSNAHTSAAYSSIVYLILVGRATKNTCVAVLYDKRRSAWIPKITADHLNMTRGSPVLVHLRWSAAFRQTPTARHVLHECRMPTRDIPTRLRGVYVSLNVARIGRQHVYNSDQRRIRSRHVPIRSVDGICPFPAGKEIRMDWWALGNLWYRAG